jgi:hypothetical protein
MTYENKNYIENARDILDDHPNLVHAIVNVYNCGYIDGIKKGQRQAYLALKAIDKSFEKLK